MGVTIHYKGKLNLPSLSVAFCEEMEDISKAMGWDFEVFNDCHDLQPIRLTGLFIYPHRNSEPLSLIFDYEGCLRNVVMLKYPDEHPEFTYMNFIKTQFAPVEIHIAVVKLLRYIQKKYMTNLEVNDEGGYWETEDAALLKKRVDFLNFKMDELKNDLNSINIKEGESPESIAEKIEYLLSKKLLKGYPPKQK